MAAGSGYLSIGEFARRAGLSVRAVRHYEQHGLVKSVRADNGRRHFRPQELSRIGLVLGLKNSGEFLDHHTRAVPLRIESLRFPSPLGERT